MMTLMVGNPGETDQDVKETLDLVYEMERRGLFAFLVPSIFTPLHDTPMEHQTGVTHTRQLSPLQWQLLMKCWKHNLRPRPVQLVGPPRPGAPERSSCGSTVCASSTAPISLGP